MSQIVILRGDYQRLMAHHLIDKAPANSVVKITPEARTNAQNDKMWAMLRDISRAKPEGRRHTPEVWKCLMMHACGHEVAFETGLNNQPFPIGFQSSKLSKAQMSDLIEFITAYGAQHNVKWSEGVEYA